MVQETIKVPTATHLKVILTTLASYNRSGMKNQPVLLTKSANQLVQSPFPIITNTLKGILVRNMIVLSVTSAQ